MNNFEYHVPTKVFFGKGQHLRVGEIIKSYGYRRVLLHYGRGSIKAAGTYNEITASLHENDIAYIEFGGVEPNPKLRHVREAVGLCCDEDCEMILAVGGGSVIDSAKHIAVTVPSDADPWDFSMKRRVPKTALPVGVVLTIAASGSETSSSVVITNEDGLLKRGFNSELVRPLFSILNPELTYTVDKYQTACGVVDIMMHTMERYFSGTENSPLTDYLAEGLLKSVIAAGKAALADPRDYEARATLMWAGSVSHNDLTGLGRSTFLACHKLEHELSGMYDSIAHGAGLAVVFPAWARYALEANAERLAQYACRVWGVDFTDTRSTALAGIVATEEYFKSLGMPLRLSEFGISDMPLAQMAAKCVLAGELPGRLPLGETEILDIFNMAR